MKIKIREELDFSKSINVRKLSPLMKIYAGIVSKWHESDTYKRKLNRSLEAAAIQQMKQDEQLKQVLLAQIYKELTANTYLSNESKVCESIIISVQAKHRASLLRILKHKDFLSYNIKFIEENPDIRMAFANMPYLLQITKKTI